MSHYHSLAGFALGCGITPEVDTPCGHTFNQDVPVAMTYSNPSLCLTNDLVIDSTHSEGSVVSASESCVSPIETPQYNPVTSTIVEYFMQSESPGSENACTRVATQAVRSLLSPCDPQPDHSLFGCAHHSLLAHPVCVKIFLHVRMYVWNGMFNDKDGVVFGFQQFLCNAIVIAVWVMVREETREGLWS